MYFFLYSSNGREVVDGDVIKIEISFHDTAKMVLSERSQVESPFSGIKTAQCCVLYLISIIVWNWGGNYQ